MRNKNLLVAGATGSGKSTLVKELKRLSARVVTLDSMDEYEDGYIAIDYDDAARYLVDNRWGKFDLILRMGQEEQYAVLELLYYAQRTEPHGPAVVIMEEATEHSDTWNIEGTPHKLYVKGRHARISSITIVQQDTDINRITKHSTAALVAFRQNYLSKTWERYFKWDQVQALTMLDEDYGKPYTIPEQDHHFLVHPNQITDLYHWWREHHGWIGKLP